MTRSDPTPHERIRTEAVERVARGEFNFEARPLTPAPGEWDALPSTVQDRYRRRAEVLVDALGDMLPVDEQWRTVHQMSPRVTETVAAYDRDDAHRYASRTGGAPEHRYLGAWTKATDRGEGPQR